MVNLDEKLDEKMSDTLNSLQRELEVSLAGDEFFDLVLPFRFLKCVFKIIISSTFFTADILSCPCRKSTAVNMLLLTALFCFK